MKVLKIATFCLILLPAFCIHSQAQVSIGISIHASIAPPPLPVYAQPPCPYDGYIWNPGFWAYGDNGYYWVPGVWVMPPQIGYLWTPCYWGYEGGYYGWHPGYWGPHVGYYGGINYGYGYSGVGFCGGMWQGRSFRYNTAVVNVNTRVVRNTYIDRTVINNTEVNNRYSYNGPGGVNARPRPEEQAAMRENHIRPTPDQLSHQQSAARDRNQFADFNHGRPARASLSTIGASGTVAQVRTPSTGNYTRQGSRFSQPAAGRNLQHESAPKPASRINQPQHNQRSFPDARPVSHTPPTRIPQVRQQYQPQRPAPQQYRAQPVFHQQPQHLQQAGPRPAARPQVQMQPHNQPPRPQGPERHR